MAQRCTYLIVLPDSVQVYSTPNVEKAVEFANKKSSGGIILHVFYNIEERQIEVREVQSGGSGQD